MKILKMMLCGAFLLGLAACSSPESDAQKAVDKFNDAAKIGEEKGYDSQEYKDAEEEANDFYKECQEKYKGNKEDSTKFEKAYEDIVIKALKGK